MVHSDNVSILAEGFVRIHKAITRGINTGIDRGNEYERNGLPGTEEIKGYFLYIQSLTIVLSAHHLGEDEVAFPELKKWIPDGPFARLSSEHHKIEPQVTLLTSLVTDPKMDGNLERIKKVVDILKVISAVWSPHIAVEEEVILKQRPFHENEFRRRSQSCSQVFSTWEGTCNPAVPDPSLCPI